MGRFLTPEQIAEIKAAPRTRGMVTALAEKFGVSTETVSATRNGRTNVGVRSGRCLKLRARPDLEHLSTKEYNAVRRADFKEERAAYDRKRHYGLTPEAYEALLEGQDRKCAICRQEKKLFVDHCHAEGHVRGLLCRKCNTGIGMLQDDPTLLRAAAAFLER